MTDPPPPKKIPVPPPVDLIIPARNEAPNIPALFDALDALPPGTLRRVVVCDNGSTDATAQLARARGAIVVHEPRPGYGAACLAGLARITPPPPEVSPAPPEAPPAPLEVAPEPPEVTPPRPDVASNPPLGMTPPAIVAFLDADLADDPAQLPRLLEPLARGQADLVLGSRPRLAEPGALDRHQRFGNRLACTLLRLTTGRRYTDLGPMRAVTWAALGRLAMRDTTWGWTVEMQFKAARRGLRVVEIDVPYRQRRAGRSKISGSLTGSLRAGTKILATLGALTLQEKGRRAAGHQPKS